MSEPSTSSIPESGRTIASQIWDFVLPLIGFLLFSIFTLLLIRNLSENPSDDDKRAMERIKILADFKAAEAEKIGSGYGWVDSSKKIVRIPIDRAMEVVLPELQNKVVGPAYAIGSAPGAPAAAATAPATSATMPAAMAPMAPMAPMPGMAAPATAPKPVKTN